MSSVKLISLLLTVCLLAGCMSGCVTPEPGVTTTAPAGNIEAVDYASQVKLEEPEIRLVFLAESGDTRYEKYSVLRSLHVAEEVEARKNNAAE